MEPWIPSLPTRPCLREWGDMRETPASSAGPLDVAHSDMSSIRVISGAISGAPSRGPAHSRSLVPSRGINTLSSVLPLLNEDGKHHLTCAQPSPIRHEYRRLDEALHMQASRQEYGAEILMSHPTRGLVGSEWMGQLWPLLPWRVCLARRNPSAVRVMGRGHGERISGRNGGCTSLSGGCLLSLCWVLCDGALQHLSIQVRILGTQSVPQSVPRVERTPWPGSSLLGPLCPLLGKNGFVHSDSTGIFVCPGLRRLHTDRSVVSWTTASC
ncbi:hypothetical protein J3F83DRAFT_10806 [Trichoderma novae-zelandiae]